jgi:hypothetical protein
MIKSITTAAVVSILSLCASTARAGFVGFLSSSSTDNFNYTLRFTPDQAGDSLVQGDLVTLYDVAPVPSIDLVASNAASTGFVVSAQNSGFNGSLYLPGAADDPTIGNVTFIYNGPTLTSVTNLPVSLITTGGYTATVVGRAVGTSLTILGEQDSIFPVLVPQSGGGNVPEPASLGILSLGAVALLARRRRA